jgi:hypothetical protein
MEIRRLLCMLVVILAGCTAANSAQQAALQAKGRPCRIVDELPSKTDAVYYVDGVRVPDEIGVLEVLRRRDKVSPSSCIHVFVTTSARIRDVEELRVMAGKMDFKEFHAYLFDLRYRDTVTEINYYGDHLQPSELRAGPRGPLPWPVAQSSSAPALLQQVQKTITKVRTYKTVDGRTGAAERLAGLTRKISSKDVTKALVTDITSLLDSPDDSVRYWVAMALGNLGPAARAAIPKLQEMLPKAACVDGVITSASGIREALMKMGIKSPFPSPKCEPISG